MDLNSPFEASQPIEPRPSIDVVDFPLSSVEENGLSDADELMGKSERKRAMNSTAYRIFKLLQWLIQEPLSVDAMNARFCADPLICKPVSNDSIWLYINTLKSLGCNIKRPSPKNSFQYEMVSHPFGLALTEDQLDALSQAKAFAQQRFTRQEMRALDALLKKVVSFTVCEDPQQLVAQLFARSRSFDYEDLSHHVEALEHSAVAQQLIQLTYLSPQHGEKTFHFLPMSLFYERGVVYVRGERADFDHPSTLRVDRVLGIAPAEDDGLKTQLQLRQQDRTEVVIQVFVENPEQFVGFGLDENKGIYHESLRWVDRQALPVAEASYYEVILQIREFFFLKQTLLLCGLPFRIAAPSHLRDELRQTLEVMKQYYQTPCKVSVTGGETLG